MARHPERPVVWVTGPARGGLAAWWFTRFGVWRAGGRAVRVVPNKTLPARGPDALILGGGADVGLGSESGGPQHEAPVKDVPLRGNSLQGCLAKWVLSPAVLLIRGLFSAKSGHPIDRSRDRLERELLQGALQRGLPVLGICRGMQLLNVVLGGTLHEEVKGFYTETPHLRTVWARKRVSISANSRIAAIMGSTHAHVNALHHQAVDALGAGLRVTAVDDAGVIQAIEMTGRAFVVGVQWHPEYLPQSRQQRSLFDALVEAAGNSAGAR